MRKLTLDLDSLAVQSFETTPDGAAARGTVRGEAAEATPYCQSPVCLLTEQPSCKGTCEDTCYDSCFGSCGSCIASCPGTCAASCGDTCPYCVEPTTDPVYD
jgi:hypothetical protein